MQSRYVLFPQPGRVELATEDVAAPGPGQLLCQAEASLISSGTELTCLRGEFDPGTNWADWIRFPFRPGYSMAARVVAAGGDSDVRPGDLIASWTPHAQRFIVDATAVNRVPAGVSAEEAAFTVLGSTTQLAVRRSQLQLGERVGVIGLGLLGQLVVQYCLVAGARTVIAIDQSLPRLDAAHAHGATHTVNAGAADAHGHVAEITGGRMLDVLFDVTGHPDVLAPAIGLVRQLGRVVLLGDTPTPSRQALGPGVVSNSVAILGIHAHARPDVSNDFHPWSTGEVAALFLDYVAAGRLRVADLVTRRASPLDAPGVYADLAGDRSAQIGVILDWTTLA